MGKAVGLAVGKVVGLAVGKVVGRGVGDGVGYAVHFCALQSRTASVLPHALPPCIGCTNTEQCLNCTPPPHCRLHVDQSDQSPSMQSTGHDSAPHSRTSLLFEQAMPPLAAAVTTDRDRAWLPPPHDFVHCDHFEKLDTTQSTGQAQELHCAEPSMAPHALPPNMR